MTGSEKVTEAAALSQLALNGHTAEKEFVFASMTPLDFESKHAGSAIDYAQVSSDFLQVCTDFSRALSLDEGSYAVAFCSKILYEIGPLSRKVRVGQPDKYWKLKFPNADCIVSTYKTAQKYDYKFFSGDTMDKNRPMISLSLKYAGMLATDELQQINKYLLDERKVLAPLAGAVFSKDCAKEIARDRGISPEQVVNVINASCQGGGHQLYH